MIFYFADFQVEILKSIVHSSTLASSPIPFTATLADTFITNVAKRITAKINSIRHFFTLKRPLIQLTLVKGEKSNFSPHR
jgi:hypothetical protein